MEIEGDYRRNGFALVKDMVPRGVAQVLMGWLRADLPDGAGEPKPVNFTFAESPSV